MKSQILAWTILPILALAATNFTLGSQSRYSSQIPGKLQFHYRYNCSHYEPIQYNISEFEGTWNYIELFTEENSLYKESLNCLKLSSQVNGTNVSLNISMPYNRPHLEGPEPSPAGPALLGSMYGFLDESREEIRPSPIEERIDSVQLGKWKMFSESFAPSKWIVLASCKDTDLLYVTCGEFPDDTCAIGEIGILSRATTISSNTRRQFEGMLEHYRLHTAKRIKIRHDKCSFSQH